MFLLRVSTRRVPKPDRSRLPQKALGRFRRDTGRRLPENQALAKEEGEGGGGGRGGGCRRGLEPSAMDHPCRCRCRCIGVLMLVISLVGGLLL